MVLTRAERLNPAINDQTKSRSDVGGKCLFSWIIHIMKFKEMKPNCCDSNGQVSGERLPISVETFGPFLQTRTRVLSSVSSQSLSSDLRPSCCHAPEVGVSFMWGDLSGLSSCSCANTENASVLVSSGFRVRFCSHFHHMVMIYMICDIYDMFVPLPCSFRHKSRSSLFGGLDILQPTTR